MKKLFIILPLVLVLCFTFGCQNRETMAELEAMKARAKVEEQHKADLMKLAEKVQEAFDNQDIAAMAQLYAEDATIYSSGDPEPIRGREAFEKNQASFLRSMPDFSVEFTLILISGNHIVFEGVSQGTFTGPMSTPEGDIPPTGKSMKNKFAFIVKVNADGLIEEDRTYCDNLSVMQQLGLIEQ